MKVKKRRRGEEEAGKGRNERKRKRKFVLQVAKEAVKTTREDWGGLGRIEG